VATDAFFGRYKMLKYTKEQIRSVNERTKERIRSGAGRLFQMVAEANAKNQQPEMDRFGGRCEYIYGRGMLCLLCQVYVGDQRSYDL